MNLLLPVLLVSATFFARNSVLLSPLFERASLIAAEITHGFFPESDCARSLYLFFSTVSSGSYDFFGVYSGPVSSNLDANLGLSFSDDFLVSMAESTSRKPTVDSTFYTF